MVHALHRLVGGDDLDGQLVDLAELGILGKCRAGHAGELVIQTEVVLQGDGGRGLVLLAYEHALFGLDGLVQALRIAATFHNAAGELVDDLDLAVGDHILLVAVEHVLGLQRLLQVVDQLTRKVGVDVIDTRRRSIFLRPRSVAAMV